MIRAHAMDERCNVIVALYKIIRSSNQITLTETILKAPAVSFDEISS